MIRDARPDDFEIICALNAAEVRHTSAMDATRLAELHALSCHHRVAVRDGMVCAFLLAMSDDARYVNENFEWFAGHFARFIYVDRIVVSSKAQGMRLGSQLYADLFAYARFKAVPFVTCEYNIVPPNEPSRAFHEKLGFSERGTRWADGGSKRVSLQAAPT